MELRRLVVYDLREHATWRAAHAACRGEEGVVSSSAKRHLSQQDIKDLGATPDLMAHRIGTDGRAGQGGFSVEMMFHRPDLSSLRSV